MLVFSSAHVLRVLAARWLGLPPQDARCFVLGTASLSALGYDHNADEPVIRFWNAQFDVNHRYVATKSAEAEMVAKGWIQEGRVWCARLLHQ